MKLTWDDVGNRLFETGTSKGVVYPAVNGIYPKGAAWNGLSAVTESPSGAESNKVYADNLTYLNLISTEEFGAKIEAYTYPDEFGACDGSASIGTGVSIGQQKRQMFGLSYQTVLGNDVEGNDYGYKIHLIYGANAAPSERAYATINDSPEAMTLSWDLTTTPVAVTGHKPTASITIDSTKVDAAKLAALETILYGSESADARLPLPDEVAAIFAADAPSALALSSISPADATPDVAVDSTIVLTFNNKIDSQHITVASAGGVSVSGSIVADSTGKILTFTPASNLSNATVYLVTVTGVTDIYSQTLATTVKHFTTVSA